MARPTTISEGLATCVNQPRGASGLEGYSRGEKYRFVELSSGGFRWFRVYPDEVAAPGYYETCGSLVFHRYFERAE